jgi:hypothetical protein
MIVGRSESGPVSAVIEDLGTVFMRMWLKDVE